jgi:hypothetical protein
MKPASSDRRPIHHSPIFWIGVALCLAAIAIYLWSDDLSWRPAPIPRWIPYKSLISFSAASMASVSDSESSSVTVLDVVLPRINKPDCT